MNADASPLSDLTPPIDLDRVINTLRTTYRCFIRRSVEEGPSSLVAFFKENLPHLPEDSWPERFEFGGVYVNGKEVSGDIELPIPARIEYYEPKFEIASAASVFPAFQEDSILFDDGSIAIVYKPPHLPSMPAKEQRHFSLKASLERHFGRTIHMPSRLDISAQGILVVSTSPNAHAGLQQVFESRKAHKTYRFASDRSPPWTETLVDFNIAQSPRHSVLRRASRTEGQVATTKMTFSHAHKSASGPFQVITAKPLTGRTHQIRVHAAASGVPIVGDNFYGGCHDSYLHLVSCALSIPHPLTGRDIVCEAPRHLTPSWVWA